MLAAVLGLVLASATFAPGGRLPQSTAAIRCSGENRSPELHWSGAPKGTKSFALILHDPDAPHPGGFYHWVYYDIPPSARSIAASFDVPARHSEAPAGWGINDTRAVSYHGPCPPPGKPHHYDFTLYALDVATVPGDHLTAPQLLSAMQHHILAQTTLTGLFGE